MQKLKAEEIPYHAMIYMCNLNRAEGLIHACV